MRFDASVIVALVLGLSLTTSSPRDAAAQACENTSDTERGRCWTAIAIQTGNARYCEYVEGTENQATCYLFAARTTGKPACNRINAQFLQGDCDAQAIAGEGEERDREETRQRENRVVEATERTAELQQQQADLQAQQVLLIEQQIAALDQQRALLVQQLQALRQAQAKQQEQPATQP